ncbi:MAG TPA: ParB/RepB/Spo0J family partition protein, partial [Bacillota bacterium]|nr:ParB/RepB/Spo0J family partition protein [Bacillota bacterium]
MAKGKSLGRGLDALFADNSVSDNKNEVTTLRLFDIEPNREQPRKRFVQEQLEELADSIKEHGLLQPLIVRPKSNGLYEIVAGERRWRASKLAGLSEVPVIIKELDQREASEIALVENLQREDLNPVEEANGYKTLMAEYSLTQEQVALRVGKSRAAVANAVRILTLPESILETVIKGELSYAHARTILPLAEKFDSAELERFAKTIVEKKLSVRETEKLVRS